MRRVQSCEQLLGKPGGSHENKQPVILNAVKDLSGSSHENKQVKV
jgi:hypothetical protein